MTTFDDREQSFERKFAHDEELAFKATAKRNKLIGLWAAEKLGKSGEMAEHYAKDIMLADFEDNDGDDIAEKLLKDLKNGGVETSAHEIKREMDRLMAVARERIMGTGNT